MSYFALLDSDSENESSNIKVAVKKETKDPKNKDSKSKAAVIPASTVAVDSKTDNKQKENKNSSVSNTKEPKKVKDNNIGADKKNVKKDVPSSNNAPAIEAVDPDIDTGKEHRMDREHGKTKHYHGGKVDHGGRFGGGRGGGNYRRNNEGGDDRPAADPSDHDYGVERAPRKREYDRRSSTGRSGEQRKGGRGPHSFGNEKQEGAEAEKNPAAAEPDIDPLEPIDENVGESTTEAEGNVVVTPEVEEPKVFTYDEYLKKKNESMVNVANKELFSEPKNIRTVEKSEFQGLKTKEQEETVFMAKPVTKTEKKSAPQRSTAKTTAIDVGFKVVPAEETPFSGDRRGRGGGDRDKRYSPRTSTGDGFDLNADLFPSL